MSASESFTACVAEVGLCTPLGIRAGLTCAEMLAGTVRFAETEVLDRGRQPIRASRLALLDAEATRFERIAALAVTALEDLCTSLVSRAGDPGSQVRSYWALPKAPGLNSGDLSKLEAALEEVWQQATGSPFEEGSRIQEGRAGFFLALQKAIGDLASERVSAALVGGCDSLCDRATLKELDAADRLLSERQIDGRIPGEGAGFLLLQAAIPAPKGRVLAVATSREPEPLSGSGTCRAEGLTRSFRGLREHAVAGSRRVDHLLSCQTGESFFAQEFVQAYLRNAALMPEPLTTDLVAESLGDVGAAAGAVQSALALEKGLLPELPENPSRVLIYGCSDHGQVGATVVEGPGS